MSGERLHCIPQSFPEYQMYLERFQLNKLGEDAQSFLQCLTLKSMEVLCCHPRGKKSGLNFFIPRLAAMRFRTKEHKQNSFFTPLREEKGIKRIFFFCKARICCVASYSC